MEHPHAGNLYDLRRTGSYRDRWYPKPKAAARSDLSASYLTHELRAPVTAIRLGLEILREQISGRLRDEERNILSVVVRNTARLETLVNDIMDYSKIMAGKLSIEKIACDPRSLISEAADGLHATALAHGVELAIDDASPLPRIAADHGRIMQILTNLLSNGIKFTPARGRVTVTPNWASASTPARSSSRSRTPAAASRPRTSRRFSTCSCAPSASTMSRARAWAWRWRA